VAKSGNESIDTAPAGVKVFALWNHALEDARSLARDVLTMRSEEGPPRIVFARLVGSKESMPSELLGQLRDDGITVVTVANRCHKASDDDPALKKAVLARLREEARLVALEQSTPPAADEQAAKAVEQALSTLSKPTASGHREFLDDFYGPSEADDGCR